MEHLTFADEADLIHQLRPGVDGLILADGETPWCVPTRSMARTSQTQRVS